MRPSLTVMENATGQAVARPPEPGIWTLSAVATAAFGDQPQTRLQWPLARRWCLRLMIIVSMLVSERRVHPSGRALCLLVRSKNSGSGRAVALTLLALFALVALVIAAPLAFWAVAAVATVLLGPQLIVAVRAHAARARLARLRLKSPYVGVHTVASLQPGAGRELMQSLNEEADAMGWTLVLDAANGFLAAYYADLGYVALSDPVAMPWGESTVRMMRAPTKGGSPT